MSNADTTTRGRPDATIFQEDIIRSPLARRVLAIGRIIIGFFFLWPFFDKLFGLGYATPNEAAWINGGAPAQGFINGIETPFASLFDLFANPFGDVLFMAGLLGIGAAMLLGAGLRIAAVGGLVLMLFMWLAQLPWEIGGTNPVLTSHWVEGILLAIAAATLSGDTWGLGRWWGRTVGNSFLR